MESGHDQPLIRLYNSIAGYRRSDSGEGSLSLRNFSYVIVAGHCPSRCITNDAPLFVYTTRARYFIVEANTIRATCEVNWTSDKNDDGLYVLCMYCSKSRHSYPLHCWYARWEEIQLLGLFPITTKRSSKNVRVATNS